MRRNWLTYQRMEKGLTQMELANVCGVSNRTISNIEMGHRLPSGELAYKLAQKLDFDMKIFYQDGESA